MLLQYKIRENNTGGTTELLLWLARVIWIFLVLKLKKKKVRRSQRPQRMTEGWKTEQNIFKKYGTERERAREQPSRGWLQDEQQALILISAACYCKCKAAAWICRTDGTVKNEINKKRRWKRAAVEAALGRGEMLSKLKYQDHSLNVAKILQISFNVIMKCIASISNSKHSLLLTRSVPVTA